MDNTTWHDQRPSHKPIPHAVSVAQVHYDIAQQVYDDYVERCLNDPDNPLNWPEIDTLARRANEADRKLREAKYAALNPQECTCPDLPEFTYFELCPVCKADIDRRYGDSIPIGGE